MVNIEKLMEEINDLKKKPNKKNKQKNKNGKNYYVGF